MAMAPPQPGWCDVIREHAATDRGGTESARRAGAGQPAEAGNLHE